MPGHALTFLWVSFFLLVAMLQGQESQLGACVSTIYCTYVVRSRNLVSTSFFFRAYPHGG